MNRYYKVLAKGGHVGLNHYVEMTLFLKAKDGKDAAYKARYTGRVKHDRKDAIISVEEINYSDYREGLDIMYNDPYMQCSNVQEQRLIMDQIEERVKRDEHNVRRSKNYHSDKEEPTITLAYNKRIRNYYKYTKMNAMYA